ncbi:MAG: LytR/AlgR family response regulator transcription factor [Prolixibacteraceae bacterium]
MTRILIIEDELPSARKLSNFVQQLEPDFIVVDILQSVSDSVQFFKSNSVDLIFLDIHLADGNSFNIFKEVQVDTPIIFTTAFDQYAIEAFNQNSIGYLLKPLSKDALKLSIQKYKTLSNSQTNTAPAIDYKLLGDMIAKQKSAVYQERFMVYYKDKIKTVLVDEVAYFYADSKAVFMTLHDGKSYDLNFSLDQLEEKLNPNYFFRANRQFIVHIQSVEEASIYSKSKLKLHLAPNTPIEVIVSSQKASRFKQWLNQ